MPASWSPGTLPCCTGCTSSGPDSAVLVPRRNLGIGRLPEYWNLGIDRCRNFGRRMLCRQNTFLGRSICRCSIGPYFHGICQCHKLGTRFALCLAATFLLRNLGKSPGPHSAVLVPRRSFCIGRLPDYWNLGIDRCRNFGRRMLCRQNTFRWCSSCKSTQWPDQGLDTGPRCREYTRSPCCSLRNAPCHRLSNFAPKHTCLQDMRNIFFPCPRTFLRPHMICSCNMWQGYFPGTFVRCTASKLSPRLLRHIPFHTFRMQQDPPHSWTGLRRRFCTESVSFRPGTLPCCTGCTSSGPDSAVLVPRRSFCIGRLPDY